MKELGERELRKLRELSNKCSANKKTQEYVHEVCLRIKELLIHYARDTKQDARKVLEKYFGHTAAPANFSTGQIPAKYIAKAIEAGNIRERITLIMNFCMSGCAVILWALEKNKYFTQGSIDVLHKRLYNHFQSQPPHIQKAIQDGMTAEFLKKHANQSTGRTP
jgi:hypothetical protein